MAPQTQGLELEQAELESLPPLQDQEQEQELEKVEKLEMEPGKLEKLAMEQGTLAEPEMASGTPMAPAMAPAFWQQPGWERRIRAREQVPGLGRERQALQHCQGKEREAGQAEPVESQGWRAKGQEMGTATDLNLEPEQEVSQIETNLGELRSARRAN